jgi:acetylornithine deacetylase/succinyl-diaminopimelate desuccinylase-like protein
MTDPALPPLLEFLRFKSISTDRAFAADIAACAQWLAGKLSQTGLQAEVHPTAGHPIVLAKTEHRADRKTVLIYGHYDVQPVDPIELWESPPFEPRIADGRIFARGATDNKGQIMAHVLGVATALERDGELPVNLIMLIEGEEEIGSPNLELFLRARSGELRCDVVVISDTGMVAPNVPTLTYGLRGIAAIELTVTGPAMDLHSGIFGGAVANPLTALVRLLSTLHDEAGRVAVAGFYDGVPALQAWEKEAWAKLPLGEESLREVTGAPELAGEPGFTPLERTWARPTAEINGLGGGYQGEGTKTVIPRQGMAKLTFRLVPGQEPVRIVERVISHLRGATPAGVRLAITGGHTAEPYLMDPHSPHGLAAQRALRATFGAEPTLIREGGSIPIVQSFRQVLGVDTLLVGLALPDCRAHSPNENFPIENFEAGIRLNQSLLRELSKRKGDAH